MGKLGVCVAGTSWWDVGASEAAGEDLRRGDRLSFNTDNEVLTHRRWKDEDEQASYEINESQIHFPKDGLVFDYRTSGDTMKLTHSLGGATLYLRRVTSDPVS